MKIFIQIWNRALIYRLSFCYPCQVIYQSDSVYLDLFDLAQMNSSFVETHGHMLFNKCDDDETSIEEISFLTEESFVELPPLTPVGRNKLGISIEFRLKTTELHGLLLYGLGRDTSTDRIAFELFEGIQFKINYNVEDRKF